MIAWALTTPKSKGRIRVKMQAGTGDLAIYATRADARLAKAHLQRRLGSQYVVRKISARLGDEYSIIGSGSRQNTNPWGRPRDKGPRIVREIIDSAARDMERALPSHAGQPELRCHAARDGECYWTVCPQIRDGEPSATGRHCPLDIHDDDE